MRFPVRSRCRIRDGGGTAPSSRRLLCPECSAPPNPTPSVACLPRQDYCLWGGRQRARHVNRSPLPPPPSSPLICTLPAPGLPAGSALLGRGLWCCCSTRPGGERLRPGHAVGYRGWWRGPVGCLLVPALLLGGAKRVRSTPWQLQVARGRGPGGAGRRQERRPSPRAPRRPALRAGGVCFVAAAAKAVDPRAGCRRQEHPQGQRRPPQSPPRRRPGRWVLGRRERTRLRALTSCSRTSIGAWRPYALGVRAAPAGNGSPPGELPECSPSHPHPLPARRAGLEPVEKVVTQAGGRGLKSSVQAGSTVPCRWARGRKVTGRIVQVMRVVAWVTVTV